MRKLLALCLVLGMASIANAGFLLSVNGEPAPDSIGFPPEDPVEPSTYFEIDVDLSAGVNAAYDVLLSITGPAIFTVPEWFAGTPPFYQDAKWLNFTPEYNYTLLKSSPFETITATAVRVGCHGGW